MYNAAFNICRHSHDRLLNLSPTIWFSEKHAARERDFFRTPYYSSSPTVSIPTNRGGRVHVHVNKHVTHTRIHSQYHLPYHEAEDQVRTYKGICNAGCPGWTGMVVPSFGLPLRAKLDHIVCSCVTRTSSVAGSWGKDAVTTTITNTRHCTANIAVP